MSAYLRVNVGSIAAVMSILSSRASELGATNRDARVDLYDHPVLTSAAVAALEGGSRIPTEAEREAIHDAGDRLGWGITDALLAGLEASA